MNNHLNPETAALPVNPADEDLAEQAKPGHGIPSQDPDVSAQHPMDAATADREAKSVMTGGGTVAGAVTGAAVGTAVGGPVGTMIGAAVGAVAGAVAGGAAGAVADADDHEKA